MVFKFTEAEFHWQWRWFCRPDQRIGMTVEDYYTLFCDWKEEMVSLSFPAEEEDYIDGFIQNLRWDIRWRLSKRRSSCSRLDYAFYDANFEESMIRIEESLKKIDTHMVFDERPSRIPADELQQDELKDSACIVFEEIPHNITMAFRYEKCEESITVREDITKGNNATKMFDGKPKPVLIDEIEVKGVVKDSDKENDIDIEDKSSLIELSGIQDAASDKAGLVFNEWLEPEFVKQIDIDVFSSRHPKGKMLQGFFPLLVEHSIMGILDYSDCFLKLESNHIIDKVTLPYTLYLVMDFLFSYRFNLTCLIHDEDLVSSCSVNKVLRVLFDPGGSSACSTGPSCGRDHYSLGSMKLKECIRLSTLVTHGLVKVNLRRLRGGGFFIDGFVCVSTNRYPYMQTSVVFREYRKVKYGMVEAGRFVTTENQWCNDFKIEKDKCMKFLEGSKVRAQEDDGRMEILDCIIIDNAPAFICSVHEVQGVLAQSFLVMRTCLMPCREAVQNSMGMDQFYIDDSFSVANICYIIHGNNMIDLSNWDGFDLAGANTEYLSSHLIVVEPYIIGVNMNRIYDLFIQEASDMLDVHQNVCNHMSVTEGNNHMSVTEGNKNLAETTNMDATIQSCVYWMRYRVHLLAAAHGIDDVRVAIDQSFPSLRILCRICGLCAISVYILEDKDDFERVGKRIISMVIMGWRTFDKSTWDHEYTVEPELIGVLSFISIMSTYRDGQFEMSELPNEILKQLEGFKNMPCLLFSLECGKLSNVVVNKRHEYLMVVASGGRNQQKSEIVGVVMTVGILGAALSIPVLQVDSIWADESEFASTFNLEFLVSSVSCNSFDSNLFNWIHQFNLGIHVKFGSCTCVLIWLIAWSTNDTRPKERLYGIIVATFGGTASLGWMQIRQPKRIPRLLDPKIPLP